MKPNKFVTGLLPQISSVRGHLSTKVTSSNSHHFAETIMANPVDITEEVAVDEIELVTQELLEKVRFASIICT